ncbi:MAG: hypothetical protein ACRD3V_11775, partial [Vicinamibacteria bacterium]
PEGVTLHTTSRLVSEDVVVRQGVRLMGPARSIVDSAQRGMAPDQVERAIQEALSRGLVTEGELLRRAVERGARVEELIRNSVESYTNDEAAQG